MEMSRNRLYTVDNNWTNIFPCARPSPTEHVGASGDVSLVVAIYEGLKEDHVVELTYVAILLQLGGESSRNQYNNGPGQGNIYQP